jgi:ABC-type transporter Mla maintaining outer membrane lipid asymmetry ATPase subunit MlaF
MFYGSIVSTITLKDVPDELRTILKQRAALNRRSLNQELLFCLEQVAGIIPSPAQEDRAWIESSKQELMKVWDNSEDDVCHELLS